MTDAEKLQFIRVLTHCIREAANGTAAKMPGNEPLRVHSVGYCDIIDAALDGDFKRAMSMAEDMPLRMQMAYAREPKR